LIVSPQCNTQRGNCNGWKGQMGILDEVMAHVDEDHTRDLARFYVMGLSTGGEGAYRYAAHAPTTIAAMVPMANCNSDDVWLTANACAMSAVPTWAFHNVGDSTQPVANTERLVSLINGCAPPEPAVGSEGA